MTMGSTEDPLRFVVAGCLTQDYILPISGTPQINVLGGNLAYAAIGLNLWGGIAGLLARVSQDYPLHWLEHFQSLGFDLAGIKVVSEQFDTRQFIAHVDSSTTHTQDPVQHFADRGLAYPPGLLGYQANLDYLSSRKEPMHYTIQISDVPESYLEVSAVHICPIDYLSHIILPSVFRQGLAATITLSSDPGYMTPSFWEEIPGLLSELTAFITNETDIRNLFRGRLADLWEMADVLGGYGPEYILIRTDTEGYYLYDRVNGKRWVVPNYKSKVVDTTGRLDAFAGSFLLGYREHYDPLEGALMGSIADSLVQEGSGVFYAMDAMPGLIDVRLEVLRDLVCEI